VNTEVGERHEVLLIYRVPNAQLRGDLTIEVPKNVETVSPLGGCGQAEELGWLNVSKQPSVRGCGSMMKLIDDNDVEVRWVQQLKVGMAQALNGCEDVLEL